MFRIKKYEIKSNKLPRKFDGYKIVQISDLHGKIYGKDNEYLLRESMNQEPDLVVMTGDIADNTKNAISQAIRLCKKISSEVKTYYVTGNHELTLKRALTKEYLEKLSSVGVHILENDHVKLYRSKESIFLYGIDMPLVYYNDPFHEYKKGTTFTLEDMKRLMGNCDLKHFNILLAHNPIWFQTYKAWGADLTLSGHMHGGIVNVPGMGGLLSPEVKLFPEYCAGQYIEEGKQMIVSRGLGNHVFRRINNPEELVVINFIHQETR